MNGDPHKEFLIQQIHFLDRVLKGVHSVGKIRRRIVTRKVKRRVMM